MSKQPLLYEVWRVCRETDIADLMAAFIDQDDAEGYAHEFVETDRFDALIRATAADAVVNYTERVDRAHEHLIARLSQFNGIQPPEVIKAIYRYRDAVASERDAVAIRAFGKRVWSDTEEVAYQAGVTDERAASQAELAALKHDIARYQAAASSEAAGRLAADARSTGYFLNLEEAKAKLARLREPDVREALQSAFMGVAGWHVARHATEATNVHVAGKLADAALTKITEMLTP